MLVMASVGKDAFSVRQRSTKLLSILISVTGRLTKRDNPEKPVPKSSTDKPMPHIAQDLNALKDFGIVFHHHAFRDFHRQLVAVNTPGVALHQIPD